MLTAFVDDDAVLGETPSHATGIGSVFSTILPNFTDLLPVWWATYGWFFGVGIGGSVYWVLATLRPRVAPAMA